MSLAQLYDHHGIEPPGSGVGGVGVESGVGVGVGGVGVVGGVEINLPDLQHDHHHTSSVGNEKKDNNHNHKQQQQRRQDSSCERRVRLYKHVAEVGPWLDDVYYGPREAVREYR